MSGQERPFVFLSDWQLELLSYAAEGLEVAAIAERAGRDVAEIRGELADARDALGARSLLEGVVFAADRAGLRAPDALADDIAEARRVRPLSEPLRGLVRDMAAGATPEELAKLLGRTRQRALQLAVLAGLHRPPLTEAGLELLRHAARGHARDHCARKCNLPGPMRTAIVRALGVPNITAAVAVAIRDYGLEPDPELADPIERLRREGLRAQMRAVVRDVSYGASRKAIAAARSLTVPQIETWFVKLWRRIGLTDVPAGSMRETCTVAIVVWADPGDPDPATLEPALDDDALGVLHWVALGYDTAATAKGLNIPESAVLRAHYKLYSVFGLRDLRLADGRVAKLRLAAARAAKLGVLTLPSTQDEPRRLLREADFYSEELEVFGLILEGLRYREIAARIGWPVRLVESTIKGLRDAIGVGRTINALVLLVEADLVQVPAFRLDLDPPTRPLRKAQGDEPEPWAELESARGGRDDS